MKNILIFAAAALIAGCGDVGTQAAQSPAPDPRPQVSVFRASLSGDHFPTQTGSAAVGEARIIVDHAARDVDLDLIVRGITPDDLWDRLVAAPIGPMHLHLYKPDGDVVFLIPFPYGAHYAETVDGFKAHIENAPYAEGAALVNSALSFDDFIAGLNSGHAYLNIHTDAFHDGEISGLVTAE